MAAVGLIGVLLFAIANQPSRLRGDAAGHAELHRLGRTHQGAWSGRPQLTEYLVAALHFTGPSNFYHGRYEAQRQALVDSGYLVSLAVRVPDLQAQVVQVLGVLTNTSAQAQAYVQWTFDTRKEEVRLLCRTQDIALWKQTLAPFSR